MTVAYAGSRLTTQEKFTPTPVSGIGITLRDQNVFTVTPSRDGFRIYCDAGRLWLTQAGDATDYLIGAGESFQAKGNGTVVVQAMEASSLRLR